LFFPGNQAVYEKIYRNIVTVGKNT